MGPRFTLVGHLGAGLRTRRRFGNLQLPSAGPPERTRLHQSESEIADPEHPVAQLLDGDPEAGLVRTLRVTADRWRRIAEQGNVEEIRRTDLGRAEAVPPGGDEGAPAGALAVGRLQHLVEIAEEAGDAGDLEDAADDVCPVLK